MSKIAIKDLATSKELDREAMAEVFGGHVEGLASIDVLSPDFYNKVTPITGLAEIKTIQTNNLLQSDATVATNGYGINFVGNNKAAIQDNYNHVSDFLNPFVS